MIIIACPSFVLLHIKQCDVTCWSLGNFMSNRWQFIVYHKITLSRGFTVWPISKIKVERNYLKDQFWKPPSYLMLAFDKWLKPKQGCRQKPLFTHCRLHSLLVNCFIWTDSKCSRSLELYCFQYVVGKWEHRLIFWYIIEHPSRTILVWASFSRGFHCTRLRIL